MFFEKFFNLRRLMIYRHYSGEGPNEKSDINEKKGIALLLMVQKLVSKLPFYTTPKILYSKSGKKIKTFLPKPEQIILRSLE